MVFTDNPIFRTALDCCAKWLAHRTLTTELLRKKLITYGFKHDLIEIVLERAKNLNWLNEEASARAILLHSLRLGEGPYLAEQKLKQKGVLPYYIKTVLRTTTESEWIVSAIKACKKHYLKKRSTSHLEQSLKLHLLKKGFTKELCNLAIPAYIASVKETPLFLNNFDKR